MTEQTAYVWQLFKRDLYGQWIAWPDATEEGFEGRTLTEALREAEKDIKIAAVTNNELPEFRLARMCESVIKVDAETIGRLTEPGKIKEIESQFEVV